MQTTRISPNSISYKAAIGACGRAENWQVAMHLFREMPRAAITPNVIIYNTTITAAEKAGVWPWALALFHEINAVNLQPNIISYSATISGQWQMVCQIFDQICEANFSPDVYTYNAAIGACTRSGEWQLALHFFARSTDLNSASVNAVLTAAGERDAGMRTSEKEHQIYPRLLAKAVDILDLHDCNSEAATLAVRWWLSQVVLPILLNYGDRNFILVTGWGRPG
ncbi:unnamed protein product [Symbiodinium sp. CCMP2456]|nr:unnamed protein product [Symbiodinium sp. CCMP2456]